MKLLNQDGEKESVEIQKIAEWLADTPIKVKYQDFQPLWNSKEEYRSLINRLIENSTDEVKSKLETQLEAFNNSISVVQQLESDYNFTQILKELIRDNKTEILNEIKNAFGEDERAFLFPKGHPLQQLMRLKSFLTTNANLNEAFLKIQTRKLLEYLKTM
jgi:Iap family predicted aminopeptidase